MELADFYRKLELVVELLPVEPWQAAHVADLMAHSHEFNLNSYTLSAAQVGSWLHASGINWLMVMIRDRFGDYGGAGVIALARRGDTLDVDTFVLNCRVLGKGVEQEILSRVKEMARAQGASQICLHY